MIIAALTTCIELLMQAYTYELYQILGIFIPLITTNCVILGRADGFAAKHNPLIAGFDGLLMGLGFALVLVALGGLRELVGTGAVFANMQLLFGPIAADWQLTLVSDYKGFLLAILPPGAFIVLGLLIAGVVVYGGRAPLEWALLFALPLALVFGFQTLGSWYLVRALPTETTPLGRLVASWATAALLSALHRWTRLPAARRPAVRVTLRVTAIAATSSALVPAIA